MTISVDSISGQWIYLKVKVEISLPGTCVSAKDRATLILGDINICYEKQRIDQNIQYLKSNNFKQLVKGSTHFLGGHIDHAYFVDPKLKFVKVDLELYSPYYTARDHDGLLITLINKQ